MLHIAKRFFTNDRQTEVLTVGKIGRTRELTPEGYLLCRDVRIARTGEMYYLPSEVPVAPNSDGFVRISRTAEELFAAASISSINGKPIVDGHPPVDVDPINWRSLSLGIVLNPRRGEGEDSEYLVADLLVTDKHAIDMIERGQREVSCGYTPTYIEITPGYGEQRNIIYNHLALVKSGRCGPRCAIGDEETDDMNLQSLITKVRGALATGDSAAIKDALDQAEAGGSGRDKTPGIPEIHLHVPTRDSDPDDDDKKKSGDNEVAERLKKAEDAIENIAKSVGDMKRTVDSMAEKMKAEDEDKDDEEKKKAEDEQILGELQIEAPPGTGDRARVARDSDFLRQAFDKTVSGAEILAPGIAVPTFDRAADPKQTFRTLDAHRRKVLELAYGQPATRDIIEQVAGGRTIDFRSMTHDTVRTLFSGSVALRRARNNGGANGRTSDFGVNRAVGSPIKTIADLNAANAAYWEKQAGKK